MKDLYILYWFLFSTITFFSLAFFVVSSKVVGLILLTLGTIHLVATIKITFSLLEKKMD